MSTRTGRLIPVIVIATAACAATLEARTDYILAHPHGWVELSLHDVAIPSIPTSEPKSNQFVRPDSCDVEISLNREPLAWGQAYPVGEQPPYSVETGFRFPAPVGPALFSVTYSGCDVEKAQSTKTTAQLNVAVEEGRVTEVHFNGTDLVADSPRDNSVVTLDDIYEAVTGRTKSVQ
jgi:hypothetical protein